MVLGFLQKATVKGEIKQMNERMVEFTKEKEGACSENRKWKVGDLVAVLEPEDNIYYRAQIVAVEGSHPNFVYSCICVDFGFSLTVACPVGVSEAKTIFSLTTGYLKRTPPLATECTLAFLKTAPTTDNIGRASKVALEDLVFDGVNDGDLYYKILAEENKRGNIPHIVIFNRKNEGKSINEKLLDEGRARLSQSSKTDVEEAISEGNINRSMGIILRQYFTLLESSETKARQAEKNIFSCGDIYASDDEI